MARAAPSRRRAATIDEVSQDEHQRQARVERHGAQHHHQHAAISAIDWAEFFERVSLVDDACCATSGDFAEMDFATRDLYRKAIEKLARGSRSSELEVTRRAIDARRDGRRPAATSASAIPATISVGDGRRAFERTLGFRAAARRLAAARRRRHAAASTISAASSSSPRCPSARARSRSRLRTLGAALVLARAPRHRARRRPRAAHRQPHRSARCFAPSRLPALALRGRRAERSCARWWSVPALLTDAAAVEELLERLEIHYLAIPDGDTAPSRSCRLAGCRRPNRPTDDDALLARAPRPDRPLNRRYGRRRRRPLPAPPSPPAWNETQGSGWAGSASAANSRSSTACCAAPTDTTFMPSTAIAPCVPRGVRYVITLDADTRLPRDAVAPLVGKMAHPLNRPAPRSRAAARRRGLRHPAAARHRRPADRPRGLAVPARVLRRRRHRSLRGRRLRRLSGPVRRGFVHRQGHLRRRRLRGGARRSHAGEHHAQPRSLRGHLRARRPRHRRRTRRGLSARATTSPPRASIAGCAATGSFCPGSSARRRRQRARRPHAAARPLEDARQPAPLAVGAGRRAGACGRAGSAACGAR